MTATKGLVVTALVLASTACLKLPDTTAATYGPAPASYGAPPVSPTLYQPPPLSSTLPSQPAPLPVVAGSMGGTQVRYLPPQPFSSTSLISPPPSFSSPSQIGPQRADWKPSGGC
ncbi:MAG: hypothetical protein Q8L22_27555 [Reyranella sp.]|nr:hypothetical protein [Reyranella sp.]